MAKKKTYYDPNDGNHYYHGETLGASNWGAPESIKDESYINQYNYTPSYTAYRQYLEELKRREEEEMARIRHEQKYANPYEEPVLKDPVKIRAGIAADVGAPEAYRAPVDPMDSANFQRWMEDKEKAQTTAQTGKSPIPKAQPMPDPTIMSSKDKELLGGIGQSINNAGQGVQQEAVDWAKLSTRDKYKMYMNELEDKALKQGTLPTSQRVELSNYMYRQMSAEERQAIDTIMEVEGQEFDAYRNGGANIDYQARGNKALKNNRQAVAQQEQAVAQREAAKNAAINTLKELGWDDSRIEREVARFRELEDYRKTLEYNERYAINPNDSAKEKFNKSVLNTAEAIPSTLYRGLESLAAEKGAYGRNTSSRYALSANAAQEAVGQVTQNAIGPEHPYWQQIYQAGESGAESLVVMLTTGAIASGFGLAGAGTALKGAKAAGETVTGGMKAAAAAEKAIELASLVPFSANAYESGYKDAVERGYGEGQAQAYGVAVGAIEAATEIFSLDRAWKMAEGTKMGRNLFAAAAMQAGIEGTEEVASEFGQRLADYLCVDVGKTGKTQKEIDIENFKAQGMSDEEAASAAARKFASEVLWAGIGGVISSAPHSVVMSGVGAFNSKYGSNITQAISDRYQNLEVKGDTEYEQQLKEDKERYANNPTQYIADNYKANTEEEKRTKQALQDIADKERSGKKLSASDKLYIAQNTNIDQEFIENLYDVGEESVVPYKYREAKKNISEDDARILLAQAAESGDARTFMKAQEAVRNSRNEDVAKNAEKIIADYSALAQGHGITKEDMGKAVLSEKRAYLAGYKGEDLNNEEMSNEVKVAYNEGQIARIKAKSSSTIEGDINNAEVEKSDGKKVTLKGAFTSDGKIKTSEGDLDIDDIDMSPNTAIHKAYVSADRYEDVNVKNAFLANIKEGMDIKTYEAQFDKAYDAAIAGISEENARKGSTLLDDEAFSNIFAAAKEYRSDRLYSNLMDALEDKKAVAGKGKVFNEAVTVVDKDVLDFFGKLARRTGLTIRIVDQIDNDSRKRGKIQVGQSTITVRAADAVKAVTHELAEFTESYNAMGYGLLRDAVANFASEKLGHDRYMRFLQDYKDTYGGIKGQDNSADEMSGEMFNDTIGIAIMRSDRGREAFAKFLADNYSQEQATTIGEKLADYIRKLGDILKRIAHSDPNADKGYIKAMSEYADEMGEYAEKFMKALDKAVKNYQAQAINEESEVVGVHFDEQNEMVYPTDYSLETWKASEYQTDKKAAAKALSEALGITQKKATKYIDDINSIAKIIADDRVRLDYDSDEGSAVVSNSDYGASIDFSTICKKRLLYTGTLQQIQKQIGNRVITVDDYLAIRQAMIRDQKETTCGCCYVEGSRAKLGGFMKEFIKKYAKTKPSYVPTMYDVSTPDGIRQLRTNHPEVYAAREYFLNHYGRIDENDKALFASQQKPKDYTERKAYKGEILKMFKGKSEKVATKNINGGLRLQSFSDFEVVNLLDLMQVITDMSRVGLAGQAYTKVKEFADALGNTGLKINLSLMAKGVDKNGNLVLDELNGMKRSDAEYLRNKYSKNVGTIIVCFTDEQLKAAMKDSFIDFIIPFHRSQWQQSQYEALGLPKGTRDYTNFQEDGVINEKGRRVRADHSFMSKEYWDFSKSGRENAETYIKMCNDAGKVPVFDFLLEKDNKGNYILPADADGYFKLLIDFKMYDNDGVGSPQMPVTPNFSLDECRQMLMEYEGGHETFPVDQKIADEFTKKITEREEEFKYSLDVDSEGNQLTKGQADYFEDSKIRDDQGRLKVMYHGSPNKFTVFDPKKLGGKNGTAEGYGIYFSDTQEVTKAYGDEQMKGYLNVTHPASAFEKTINAKDLTKLIKATAEKEAQRMVDAGDYDSVNDAIKDTWVSNYEYTYDKTMDAVYRNVAKSILDMNSSDMDIVQEVMAGLVVRSYEQAYNFYETLTDTLGIDGFVTEWEDSKTGEKSGIVVAFNSNQFKNIDNENPTSNEDVRYSIDIETINADEEINKSGKLITSKDIAVISQDIFKKNALRRTQHKSLNYVGVAASANFICLYSNSGDDYNIIEIHDADSAYTNIHEINAYGTLYKSSEIADRLYAEYRDNKEVRRDIDNFFKGRSGSVDNGRVSSETSDNRRGQTPGNGKGDKGIYSLDVDSRGRKLSKDQIKYFSNVSSELLTEEGALKVMYHGTPEASFTVFDPQFSDDEISLFFTDSRFVAAGYAGTDGVVDPNDLNIKGSIKTIEDLQKRFEGTDFAVREEDGQIIIENIEDPDDPTEYVREDSVEEAYQEWIDRFAWDGEEGEFGGLYEVYLNITNPLVIEGDERNWDDIYAEELIGDDADAYDLIHLLRYNDDGSMVIEWRKKGGYGGATETMTLDQFKERFGNDLYEYMMDGHKYLWVDDVYINPDGEWIHNNTRGLSAYAKKHGYDGLVINNLVDMGQYSDYEESAQIVIAFNSNQVKSVDNEHPTDNPDIRYSLQVDSEGRELTEGQQRYFNNTKVVDENGALKVMYHGTTEAGFTVFDPEKSDDGRSMFFTDSRKVAKSYSDTYKVVSYSKPISFEELADAISEKSAGYAHLYEEGKDVVIVGTGRLFNDGKDLYRGSLEGAKKYFEENIEDAENIRGNYEVYLNLENPLIVDAHGRDWNDIEPSEYSRHYADVEIVPYDAADGRVYEVDYRVDDGHYEHHVFDRAEVDEMFGDGTAAWAEWRYEHDGQYYEQNIYIGENNERLQTDTRSISEYAQANGYDGVIFKNLVDIGYYGFDEEVSTVAIAFSPDQVKDVYNLNPTSSEDIRYSLDIPDSKYSALGEDFDFLDSSSEEEKVVDILQRGMEILKNKEVDLPKLRTLALKLRNEYGSTFNTNTFVENLRKAFAYMQTEDHVDYPTMMGILRDIARPVIEESGEKVGEQEYKDFLSYFKGMKIKLTETQKQEVRHAFGSYGAFRNAIMPIMISDKADTTLDQIWDEMVEQTGYVLNRDATEGDMPSNLLDVLQAMRPTVRNDFNGDMDDLSKDLAMRIVEEYIEGEAAKEMRQQVKEYRARIKKDYQERYRDLRGQVNAELRAKNKRKAEEAQERQRQRELRQSIKVNANKLLTWAMNPSEGKSIPHDLMMPVMQFLQGIDFVDPIVKVDDNGKYHIRLFDHVDYEGGNRKFVYRDLVGDSREDVIKQFNEAIGRGEGTKEQRTWADRMQGIRELYDRVGKDDDYEDASMGDVFSTYNVIQGLDAEGLLEDLNELLSKNRDSLNMNQLSSQDLTTIDNVLKNLFHAVNQGNKAYSSPSVDIVNLAQSTMQDAEGRTIKDRSSLANKVYNFLRIDNMTPRTFFELLGHRGNEVYKFMRGGLNTEISDLKKASEYVTDATKDIDLSEVRKWTGKKATVHEFALSSGTIRMTDAQIMSLYETLKRSGAMDRIRGGIVPERLDIKGKQVEQEAVHITDNDISQILSVLTPEQKALADRLQKYLATECSEQGNETSMTLYGYKKYVEEHYFPYTVDQDTVSTSNLDKNVVLANGIERSGFTKSLKKGATNPLIIRDIFDVFTDHVASMAAYHGYAAACKDTMRWMNYREKSTGENGFDIWNTNKQAINKLSGSKQGVRYIFNLLLDINKARKSNYVGNITDALMGHYKAAAVGANLRVVAQQPTAYFRALNMINPKYLLTVNPSTAVKNIKKSQEQSPISWWKSKGYYETNLGQPIKEIVTGIPTVSDQIKDVMMSPAGWADDFTWGFLYTAVEKEQRDLLKGTGVTEEEFRKAVNDRFDEMIDNTQVVDSTLHRSQIMRSKDFLNKLQTAFMAEPTKSYNMLMESAIKDLREGKTMKRTARATAAFLISALATSAASAVVDAMRKAKDDEEWWEVWLKNFKANALDNVNPLNLVPVLKDVAPDIFEAFTGTSTWNKGSSRFDIDAFSSISDGILAWSKLVQGNSTKTGYGMLMATIKPISQITGIPVYNLVKDTVALYNTFFKNIETTVSNNNAAKNEKKKEFVSDVDKEKSTDVLDEGIVDAIESGISIYDLKGAVQSEYKNKYFELMYEGKEEEAKEIADKAVRAYVRMGYLDEEIDEIINSWKEEAVTYSAMDRAIASGEGIVEEVKHVMESKDEKKIIKHIVERYEHTIAYEDTHKTDSHWRENVETALKTVDPTISFNTAYEEALAAKVKAQEDAKNEAHRKALKEDFFAASEKKDGSAARNAIQALKDDGVEASDAKSMVSTQYHKVWKEAQTQAEKDKAKSDWMSAYKLVCNVYNVNHNDLDKTWSDWVKKQEEQK